MSETECIHMLLTISCLGGTKLPEDRVRYWNAYLLFYERKVLQTRAYGNRRSSRIQMLRKSQSSPSARHDSLSELSDLVQRGETHVSVPSSHYDRLLYLRFPV